MAGGKSKTKFAYGRGKCVGRHTTKPLTVEAGSKGDTPSHK